MLKNWHPIALLNTDYKIIAKLLAKRLQAVLPLIISDDQSGYLEGRNISNNLRNILDIIDFTKTYNLNGMIIFVDFEKAFDTVCWDFLQRCLEVFNFGPFFRHCVRTLYITNISTCVTNNGHSSSFFNPERGIRQGCPLSALLFLLVVEVLSTTIKKDQNVKGINIGNKQFKITQLADDTTLFLADEISLENALKILDAFKKCSGLKINRDKSEAIWIGASSNYRHKPCNLKWTNGPVKCLGIYMHADMDIVQNTNLNEKIQKIENICQIWSGRPLSLKGKITVIQSLLIAQILYPCAVLYVPKWFIDRIHNIVLDFLWDHKNPKIKHTCMIAELEQGGLRFPDVKYKITALKLSWIQRIFNQSIHAWKECLSYYLRHKDLVYIIVHSAPKSKDLPSKLSNFYKQIFSSWHDLLQNRVLNIQQIQIQPLWCNSNILVDGKTVCNKQWIDCGIIFIKDICGDNGNILSLDQLSNKYRMHFNFLEYLSLTRAIPHVWKQHLTDTPISVNFNLDDSPMVTIQNIQKDISKLRCRDFYWCLVQNIVQEPTSKIKWIDKYAVPFDDLEWNYIYLLPHRVTIDTSLQSLQIKILHRIFPCGSYLSKIGKKESELCLFCNDDKEDDIFHYFHNCKHVQIIWQSLSNLLYDIYQVRLNLSVYHTVFGIVNLNDDIILDIYNCVILLTKRYIYECKKEENTISFIILCAEIKHYIDVLKIVMCKNNKSNEFNRKWQPILLNIPTA